MIGHAHLHVFENLQQGPSLQQAYYVYDELLSLPSGRTPTILASHAAAHLLLGHIEEARGDVQVILALEGDYEASAQQLKGIAAAIMGRTKEGEELVKMLGGAGGGDKMREMEDKFDVAAAKFGVAAA
jgi:coatomer protein complex subunit epsilon